MPGQPDGLFGDLLDHYAILGVARAASESELRRAFRLLALRHHPDRAGAESTEHFQRIAEAYATLSDPSTRARYDDGLGQDRGRGPGHRQGRGPGPGKPGREAGDYQGPGGRIGWQRVRVDDGAGQLPPLPRLSGALSALLAAGVARRLAADLIELVLLHDEAARGGLAAIETTALVTCPTCSGLARPHVLWCRRCEFAGAVTDEVTFAIAVPSQARDGLTFSFPVDPSGAHPPLRIRLVKT